MNSASRNLNGTGEDLKVVKKKVQILCENILKYSFTLLMINVNGFRKIKKRKNTRKL